MSTRNLDKLMAPKSVVAIGASERPGSVGAAVTRNLLAGGFKGEIHLVNRKGGEIQGRPVWRSLSEVLSRARSRRHHDAGGDRAGHPARAGREGHQGRRRHQRRAGRGRRRRARRMRSWRQQAAAHRRAASAAHPRAELHRLRRAARSASTRASGPARSSPAGWRRSRSRARCWPALADWGSAQGIGFSHLVSMGDMADVDFGDVLDMLARDYETRAVLMYVEGITQARKFMSAARSVARLKPVIVLKAGRHAAAAQAAASHTGAMAGSAAVYDAAFARAGLLRGEGAGRAVRCGRDAGPRPAAAQRAAGDPDQRRRRRRHRDRPADRRRRRAGGAATPRTIGAARQGDAAHLVARATRSTSSATPPARATPTALDMRWPTTAASARCWR